MRMYRLEGAWVPLLLLAVACICNGQYNVITQSCGQDDFYCENGICIEKRRVCDGVVDCHNQEDEKNCTCSSDKFRCISDGSCIETRRRCDGVAHCPDNSDEQNCGQHACNAGGKFRCRDSKCISILLRCDGFKDCGDGSDEVECPCSSDQWQCDHGNCIKRSMRCDGRVDCPTDRSDERHCLAKGYFKCRTGKLIPESYRCNRRYDCPPEDYSDEKNCPCGEGDFKCDNGYCIPASKHCDRTHDCQDRSDERHCTYGTVCMAYQYKCSNGQCVPAESWCNGTKECFDGSDETICPCKRDQFQCRDGSCISLVLRCNGQWDCSDGDDERNCENPQCPADSFVCNTGSSVACAKQCDGKPECSGGEDEDGCKECSHYCDNSCLDDKLICNGYSDCSDGSDEIACYECDGPGDFKCKNDECIKADLQCNGEQDCSDYSDEQGCNSTLIPSFHGCLDAEFQCQDGTCLNSQFVCDGRADCNDNSDELNCQCKDGQFQCTSSSSCIPSSGFCDGIIDCPDNSDESNCTYNFMTTESSNRAPATNVPDYITTHRSDTPGRYPYPSSERPSNGGQPGGDPNGLPDNQPGRDQYIVPGGQNGQRVDGSKTGVCNKYQWRCENGPCIDSHRRCDGHVDCPFDYSDEFDCPPGSPVSLNVTVDPPNQTVRYAIFGGDVVFQCRDVGLQRAPVRWIREGGRPLKPGSIDRNGRLEMYQVSVSDSGVYICQTPGYLSYPGSEVRVTLNVENAVITAKPMTACMPYEATCSNGQCIPKEAVCDGTFDCSDKSDEDTCISGAMCEPNEYKCANRKCVLKTWLCDGDDDCGDSSDEQNCGVADPSQTCLPSEFSCKNLQCVPKSFRCDGQSDCFDGTDELGCAPQYITVPPRPSNLKLNPGDTMTLTCEAVGVPVPLISWRLNWGHVPNKCSSTSVNGVGVLTCPNMQPVDSGAYSCEAINNQGTAFARPDAIVYVNKTVCPSGYFNSEARSPSECIRCFCFGESTQCESADLFIYNMPTPLGEGGTRMLEVKITSNGDVEIDDASSNEDHYHYEALKNGASVTKLSKYENNWGWSNSHPYVTLPETYNGNQLTSYGGRIRYIVEPHAIHYNGETSKPTIIIKGKYERLVHISPKKEGKTIEIEARLTPEHWQKATPNGLVPASREDIMMALDDVQQILLRADLNGFGVNIVDFVMESAHHINVGRGAASLVEECRCPPGYEGLSCEKCASGYTRESAGPWLGRCVRPSCPAGTYGDPASGYACTPCPCPLTNRENQFSRTCSLGYNGAVVCDCFPGYEGANCEYCTSGYVGNPLIPGDSCKPAQTDNCNKVGTSQVRLPDDCVCKDNVQGRYCDQCKNDSFYLSQDFRHGCALCFCSGVSQQCMSSNLRRRTTTIQFNVPAIVDQVKVYNSAPSGPAGAVRYNAPIDTGLKPVLSARGQIMLRDIDRSRPSIYYWSLPSTFAGDKVTSYGGFLRYTLVNTPNRISNPTSNAADVQLISENHLTFHYFGVFKPSYEGILNASVQFLEGGWRRSDGKEVSREHFLLALADVKSILIKASYELNGELATPVVASIETADPTGNGPSALHVEQCVCPAGYVGTSCEDCAPGFTRSESGLYLEHCGLCECNGHSKMCHPETGVCTDCAHNTAGDHCEECKPGFESDGYGNCVEYRTSTYQPCRCDSRGEATPCDGSGRCNCKQNVEGESCDVCRPGTFGLDANNTLGCTSCYCSGVTNECHEGSHYTRIPMAAPIFGDNNGGYTFMDLNAEEVINNNFVSVPDKSELKYVFHFPATTELFWSLPVFPGNRVLSYGGTLSLKQEFDGNNVAVSEPGIDVVLVGDDTSLYWTNPNVLRSGEPMYYQVPLNEKEWFILNTNLPASRNSFMGVLKNLRRVLVRATVAPNILSTTIADVSMDTAIESYDPDSPAATGVEICICPTGYTGTSCESCTPGFYKDQHYCRQCSCNGHDCQLDNYGQVVCNCRPPYTGPNCATIGLVMELHPTIHEDGGKDSLFRRVTLTCKYRAPEPLTIQFYKEGHALWPPMPNNESRLHNDGWHGMHVWNTIWDTRRQGEIYECHTVTDKGFTLGVLTTSLPEPGDDEQHIDTTTNPPSQSTVTVTITGDRIVIQEVGSSVNFTCIARSLITSSPIITWSKVEGSLPRERTQINNGVLFITNLQTSDSGTYACQTMDGLSTDRITAVLRVPGNDMTEPVVSINPVINEYYEGDRVELECTAKGIPTPDITWQRASRRPLPISVEIVDGLLIIENALEEHSGEYICTASNSVASVDRTAVITIRPRPSSPTRQKLTVQPSAPSVAEGQSTRVICTGTLEIPADSIEWIRQDGGVLLSNVRSLNGILYIDYARMENQGIYVCQSSSIGIAQVPILVSVVAVGTPPPSQNPNITISVDHLKIPTGASGTVDCIPRGEPLPLIKWSKHAGKFGPGTSQRGETLVISNAQDDDEGYYLCEGTVSGAPIANTYIYVEIEKRQPPVVEIWPSGEQAVSLGTEYELHCRVLGGIPDPDVMWDRAGGRPLSSTTHLKPRNILRFDNIEVNDEGEYTCSATNIAGTASASSVLIVRSPPEITIRPATFLTPIRGESVNVECRASGYPEPMVSIKSNTNAREVVPPSPSVAILRIPSVSDRDDDDYSCIATNAAGTIEDQFAIRVNSDDGVTDGGAETTTASSLQSPPEITISPTTFLTPVRGDSVNVECSASGYPEPIVSIISIKNRREVVPQSRGVAILRIPSVSERDDDVYICMASNTAGTVQEQFTIRVNRGDGGAYGGAGTTTASSLRAPEITISPTTFLTPIRGDSVIVECRTNGYPEPIVSIKSNTDPRKVVPPSRGVAVLRISSVTENDDDDYSCTATNAAGSVQEQFAIRVNAGDGGAYDGAGTTTASSLRAPEITIRPTTDLTPIRGDSVIVECRANGYPEPIVSIKSNTDREVVPPSRGVAILRIPSVTQRDDDDYSCTATNAAGTAQEQFTIRVIRGDGGFGVDEGSGDENTGPGEIPNNPDEQPSSLEGYEGQPEIVIYCSGSDEYEPRWGRFDGQPLQRNAVQDGSRLIIRNVSKSDSGQYVCSLLNVYTNEISKAAYTYLSIKSGPRITLNPKKQIVQPGQSPTVECVVEGDDVFDVTWRPVNRVPSSRVEIRASRLIFHQIEVEDAGEYECFARNRFVNVSAIAEVVVSEESGRTTSESHDNEQYAHVGAAVHLSCNMTQPNLRIHWTKDGRSIPRSVRQKSDGSLFIKLVQKSDSGLYRCHVQDRYGRQTSNYINLHIEGIECSDTEFRCYDDSGCINEDLLCDTFQDCKDNSDEENCLIRYRRFMETKSDRNISFAGSQEVLPYLVAIDQPRRQYRIGENVDVLCKASNRNTNVKWEKFNINSNTKQFAESRTYGDGAMLIIQGVQESDAGVYRCTGLDRSGRSSYEDFNLVVEPGTSVPAYPNDREVPVTEYSARLKTSIDMPCYHNLNQPVSIEWRKEFSSLPADVRAQQPILHLDSVTEKDAGTYVCRVSNNNAVIEAKAILRVVGVVPRFNGESWLSLPTLRDAYRQFDIEVSFRPTDGDGLILYNSQNQGRNGDYLALWLEDGVPQFIIFDTATNPVIVKGDRPLQLNIWHTIRVSRTNTKVTMDVDNTGPFTAESSELWAVLDLNQPLYIGGVPDHNQLPSQLAGTSGFIGCVSLLILGRVEKNIMVDSIEQLQVQECVSCAPNSCLNNGVCQEAPNERGFKCICAAGYAGPNCDRIGEACREGLCGPGKCIDGVDGYKCACPVTHNGRNCEQKQSIEYPAFTGSTFLAIKQPSAQRYMKMSMNVKATSPVTDGIIMYCAESSRGHGGFTALIVRGGRLEFRYDPGEGNTPVILTSNKTLTANGWTKVNIARFANTVSMKINLMENYEQKLESNNRGLNFEIPMFVGGVDDSIVLNNNTGVTGGFNGCIKDVMIYGTAVDIVNSSIQSANVQECINYERGDIPDVDSVCSKCRNGGECLPDSNVCSCPSGFTGTYCEQRSSLIHPRQIPSDPCAISPCLNGGSCKRNFTTRMNYTCDCPLGFAGASCQMPLELFQSVGFNGNGYLELPSHLLRYDYLDREPAVIALAVNTNSDGVLLYQREALVPPNYGDYILLRIERGYVVFDWELGSGPSSITIDNVFVNDGERHQIIVKLYDDNHVSLSVDGSTKTGMSTGISNLMNADSNLYIGGIPERINVQNYPGLSGCIEHVEFMDYNRGLNLEKVAVAGRNTQRCRE